MLISGSGTNLASLIGHVADGLVDGVIAAVVSNRSDAFGLERARQAGIPAHTLAPHDYPDRDAFDDALAALVDRFEPDLVVLAGYMRILSASFVRRFAGRLLNVHPSLLPKFKGLDTYRRVLDAGDRYHGTSVHFVTETLDDGPVIAQTRVAVRPGDDEQSLSARVQTAEHKLYPRVVGWFASGLVRAEPGATRFCGARLAAPILYDEDE